VFRDFVFSWLRFRGDAHSVTSEVIVSECDRSVTREEKRREEKRREEKRRERLLRGFVFSWLRFRGHDRSVTGEVILSRCDRSVTREAKRGEKIVFFVVSCFRGCL
jgi:hypothetical protein